MWLTDLFNKLFPPTPIPEGPQMKTDEEIKAEAKEPQLPSMERLLKRERILKERLKDWESLTPEQRAEIRAARLLLWQQSPENKISAHDGLPGKWDFDKLP